MHALPNVDLLHCRLNSSGQQWLTIMNYAVNKRMNKYIKLYLKNTWRINVFIT